jgi:hypothetical protein
MRGHTIERVTFLASQGSARLMPRRYVSQRCQTRDLTGNEPCPKLRLLLYAASYRARRRYDYVLGACPADAANEKLEALGTPGGACCVGHDLTPRRNKCQIHGPSPFPSWLSSVSQFSQAPAINDSSFLPSPILINRSIPQAFFVWSRMEF